MMYFAKLKVYAIIFPKIVQKKFKIETEVENWINKYDQDMGEKQDEYEQIDGVYTEEKKQLR